MQSLAAPLDKFDGIRPGVSWSSISLKPAAEWPASPPIETEDQLGAYLDDMNATGEARAFCKTLAADGVARIDLGAEGRGLCETVASEMDRSFAARGAKRIQDAWLRSRAVRRLATMPKVRDLLSLAYGRPAFAFQTLNFRVGSEQDTHADTIHFHSIPERFMCGVWIALEDIHPVAGPLRYRPGSHKLPVLTMQGAGVNHSPPTSADYGSTYLPALERRLDAASLAHADAVLRKGEALVWAANLAHGGAPVLDPTSTRRSLVTHYFFKGCLYYTPMTSDVENGKTSVRLPTNLHSGGVEWPRLDGRLAKVGNDQILDAMRKIVFRRVNEF